MTVKSAWASLSVLLSSVFVVCVGTTSGFVSVSPSTGDTYATLWAVPTNPGSTLASTVITGALAPAASGTLEVQVRVPSTQLYCGSAEEMLTAVSPAGSRSVTDQPARAVALPSLDGVRSKWTVLPGKKGPDSCSDFFRTRFITPVAQNGLDAFTSPLPVAVTVATSSWTSTTPVRVAVQSIALPEGSTAAPPSVPVDGPP